MPDLRGARAGSAGRSGLIVLLLTALLALGGCGSSSSGGTEPRSAQLGPILLVGDLSGSTTLLLDPALLEDLRSAGVRPEALRDATLSEGVLTLPVTGGSLTVYDRRTVSPYVTGQVEHAGSGLTLRRADTQVSLHDLVMLPGTSLVTGEVAGVQTELFVLDGSTLQPLRREQRRPVLDGIRVSLHPAGATLIRAALGLSTGQLPDGVFLGIAKLTVAGQR